MPVDHVYNFQSNLTACENCAGPVSLPRLHRGVKGTQLLTRDNLFDVIVLVQECSECNILYQVCPETKMQDYIMFNSTNFSHGLLVSSTLVIVSLCL